MIQQLKENGSITRNKALQSYISRLGAIICDLNKDGWDIHGDWIKTANGKDYKYTLVEAKTRTIYDYILREDGVRVPVAKTIPA